MTALSQEKVASCRLYRRGYASGGGDIEGGLLVLLPRRPARIWTRKSLAAPGLLGRNRVLVPVLVPMSLRVSKYWVRRTRAMTSSAVAPGTDSRKCSMEERRPSMMA